jgi:hypothetical protein
MGGNVKVKLKICLDMKDDTSASICTKYFCIFVNLMIFYFLGKGWNVNIKDVKCCGEIYPFTKLNLDGACIYEGQILHECTGPPPKRCGSCNPTDPLKNKFFLFCKMTPRFNFSTLKCNNMTPNPLKMHIREVWFKHFENFIHSFWFQLQYSNSCF